MLKRLNQLMIVAKRASEMISQEFIFFSGRDYYQPKHIKMH